MDYAEMKAKREAAWPLRAHRGQPDGVPLEVRPYYTDGADGATRSFADRDEADAAGFKHNPCGWGVYERNDRGELAHVEDFTTHGDAAAAARARVYTLTPPELDIDRHMADAYGTTVSAAGRTERRIVWALFAYLGLHGFEVRAVDDGGELVKVRGARDATEAIFNVDLAHPYIVAKGAPATERGHPVMLVLGNGEDILSDWSWYKDDRDGFGAAMDGFDVERVR